MLRHIVFAGLACALSLAQAATVVPPEAAAAAASAPPAADRQRGQQLMESALGACFRKTPKYPPEAERQDRMGTSVIAFVVQDSGAVEGLGLSRSSGHASLDWAAYNHVKGCVDRHTPDPDRRIPPGRYVLPVSWQLQ